MTHPGPVLSEAAAQAVRRHRDAPCLIQGGRTLSFGEYHRLVGLVAGGLQRTLPRGARVGLFMSNCIEYLVLQMALECAGLVRVPLNARFTAVEAGTALRDCGAAALFCESGTAARAEQAQAGSAKLWSCVVDGAHACGGPTWPELTAPTEPSAALRPALPDDLCSINYTSGTSGRPKGVMMSFHNWTAVCRNMLIDRDIRGADTVAHVGPLTHASGTYFMPWFLRGACQVIVEGRPIDNLLAAIERHKVTVFTCVPTVLTRIVNSPDLDRHDLSSIRAIGYGAEPIPRNTLEKALDKFGLILTQNYGLTEAMMTVSTLAPADHFLPGAAGTRGRELRIGSIGRPYTFVDVVLRDPDGKPVQTGDIGEITIQSDHVMQGYWGLAVETAQTLRDGWIWSGDLARMDDAGFITLVGRRKEMLISGGFNIYPQELEAVLNTHPEVIEAAVICVPDPDWGETPVAFVCLTAPGSSLPEGALADFCRPLLGIRTPKRFHLVATLPKNPNGKIDKRALQALALGPDAVS